ncbi:MAG: M23 family metallopeptidase [Myxococcaceae bacterium]|nr:M23 family metallopeptidase [Myxococcaceae bacterium]MCA3011689.1 M23 family metallopeptidase [Myxococcaceae bacterium]
MANESFTLIVVPDRHSEVRRLRLRRAWVIQALVGCSVLALVAVALVVHYGSVVSEAQENPALRDENLKLKSEIAVIREQLAHVQGTLDRVERFDQKLRAITLLSDPQRNLAMGPTEAAPAAGSADNQFVRSSGQESPATLAAKLDKLSAEATRQEQSLQELQAYFAGQKSLLASVPSVWPTRGWVTSDFGSRVDPYTSERVMHAGIDIAGPHGKEIIAPSDGTVVFSGLEGGYGNVIVIDHGYGIKTRYGHLASLRVKAGERVKRGDLIAAMGNTGRSTGPHLHYEVRVNGIAQNPRKFILDD